MLLWDSRVAVENIRLLVNQERTGEVETVWDVTEKRKKFWEKLDEAVEFIPMEERLIIGADFNLHVGEGNSADKKVKGKYGYGARNDESQAIVDFAYHTDTFYSKCESLKVTCTSGGRRTQIDYILCHRV
ncbi:craniofacial development protein 2-like [Penaeus monodon]|uniref:craniofacial development protein 2-like n=1 Tax=Penaeus monodon TaxID=6687 RepID=UPI0018A74B6A|nr:craniofacial development protein 2-like [Penaeus monodon]